MSPAPLNVRARPRRPGWQGVALLFVVLGVALGVWFEVLLPWLVKPDRPISNAAERLSTELAHLKMLGRALRLHAAEHDGKFPPAISEIHWRQNMPGMDWNGLPAAASRFHSPDDSHLIEWLYYQGKTEADPPDTILAASPVAVGPKKTAASWCAPAAWPRLSRRPISSRRRPKPPHLDGKEALCLILSTAAAHRPSRCSSGRRR